MEIVRGTKGATLKFTINGLDDLTDASVEVVLNVGGSLIGSGGNIEIAGGTNTTMQATIEDPAARVCSVVLGDVFNDKSCFAQVFVMYEDGQRVFPSDIQRVTIKDNLKG